MAGNDYRVGRKPVQVLVSLALHARVRAAAAGMGVSMNDWVLDALREKVSRDGVGGVGPVRGLPSASDGSRSRSSSVRGGEGDSGVEPSDVADAVTYSGRFPPAVHDTIWDEIEASIARHPSTLKGEADAPVIVDVDRSLPAGRDARGRLKAPIIVDEWIDTA